MANKSKRLNRNSDLMKAITAAIGGNELAVEAYPYYSKNPLSKAGFDPSRVSIQPNRLTAGGHPLSGIYNPPGSTSKTVSPVIRDIYERRGVDPSDQMMVFSAGGTTPRDELLSVIAHESGHRGTNVAGSPGGIDYEEAIMRLNDLENPPLKNQAMKFLSKGAASRWGKDVPPDKAIAGIRTLTKDSRQRANRGAEEYLRQRYPGLYPNEEEREDKPADNPLQNILKFLMGND